MGKRSFAARLQQLFSAHDMTLGAPWKRILAPYPICRTEKQSV